MSDTLLVTSDDALGALVARLADCAWLALDTEFQRETTYYARLCLIQVATPELNACVDPLRVSDLDPLLAVLFDRQVTKVVHACGQDFEIFHNRWGRLPGPVFDTQVAAPLLGHPEQIGYANLVAAMLDVQLDKAHTRTDWCARPLSPEQIEYAADDVRYLARIYPQMRDALAARERLAWLDGAFAALTEPQRYATAPELAWQRLRGIERLRGTALPIAQVLAEWRERTAQQEDRPRNWVLRDACLLDIARLAPRDRQALERIQGLHPKTLRRHGEALLELVAKGATLTPPALEREPRPVPLTREQDAIVDFLQALVAHIAAQNELDATLLAPRKRLARLVRGESAEQVLPGWRLALLGEPLRAALAGELRVRVAGRSLTFEQDA